MGCALHATGHSTLLFFSWCLMGGRFARELVCVCVYSVKCVPHVGSGLVRLVSLSESVLMADRSNQPVFLLLASAVHLLCGAQVLLQTISNRLSFISSVWIYFDTQKLSGQLYARDLMDPSVIYMDRL